MPTLTLHPAATGQPIHPIWTFGGNTCHAPLWFRPDLQEHLRRVRRDLGFRHVRAHGAIGDGMQTVASDGSFDFSRVIAGLEILLEIGFKPFFEISHMPLQLARGDKAICAYGFRSEPPRDWSRWYAFARALARALVDHFGLDELRTWWFEVWNEPDLAFWSGTQAEYFRLLDLTARAFKEVDPSLRVGGPATARTNWVDAYLDHIARPSRDYPLDVPRCDFLATHAYPSDVAFVDSAEGDVKLQNSNIMRELFAAVRRKVDAAIGPQFPVICGEWNSSAGPYAFNHDHANNAAYIVKTMIELTPLVQGSLYWNISDVYEEGQFHYEPFHGGYGLITVNDVPKSSYHAFRLLNEHRGQRLDASVDAPGVGVLASRDGDELRVLLYHHQEPDAPPASAVTMDLDALPAGTIHGERIEPHHGSAYETWVEMGRPMFVNRGILDALEQASRPATFTLGPGERRLQLAAGTIVQLSCRAT